MSGTSLDTGDTAMKETDEGPVFIELLLQQGWVPDNTTDGWGVHSVSRDTVPWRKIPGQGE